VPSATLKKVTTFLDRVQANAGANYGYDAPSTAPTTTAIGLYCRMQLGWPRDYPALKNGIRWLAENGSAIDKDWRMYHGYYVTLAFRAFGGESWDRWRAAVVEHLVRTQSHGGDSAGSWFLPSDDHGVERGGRLYCTSLALLILETCQGGD
jgi:hypothetical protein